MDYSCGRSLELHIARNVLAFEINDDDESYVEHSTHTPTRVAVPAYCSDQAAARDLMALLERRGWKFSLLAAGSSGRVGSGFSGKVSVIAAKPRQSLDGAEKATAATFACALASAVARAFDRE